MAPESVCGGTQWWGRSVPWFGRCVFSSWHQVFLSPVCTSWLGVHVDISLITPLPNKNQTTFCFPQPKTPKWKTDGTQSYLGFSAPEIYSFSTSSHLPKYHRFKCYLGLKQNLTSCCTQLPLHECGLEPNLTAWGRLSVCLEMCHHHGWGGCHRHTALFDDGRGLGCLHRSHNFREPWIYIHSRLI